MELWQLDALAQAEKIRKGEVSPTEMIDSAIARIEKYDPQLGFMVDERFQKAREEALGELPDGPFKGVPLLLKDAVQMSAGDRYQHGSRYLSQRDYRPSFDTELVRRYKKAGFIILGRTKVPELTASATTEPLAHGPCRNPWNTQHSTGGSSGGSACAVASGMVAVAHANDMGGSIRIPAASCGLVGLKPSRHRNSTAPYGNYWEPLIHEHVVSRSVRDSAAVLDCTAGPLPGDLYQVANPNVSWLKSLEKPLSTKRIGVITTNPVAASIDPQCIQAVEKLGLWLAQQGHQVESATGEALFDLNGYTALGTVVNCGVAHNLEQWQSLFSEPISDLEPANELAFQQGKETSATQLISAVDTLALWSRDIVNKYADFDLLIMPTLPGPAPELGVVDPSQPLAELNSKLAGLSSFTAPFNVSGQPAISLPLALSDQGLPIGVQIIARFGREDHLLRLAAQLEQEQPWPSLSPDFRSM